MKLGTNSIKQILFFKPFEYKNLFHLDQTSGNRGSDSKFILEAIIKALISVKLRLILGLKSILLENRLLREVQL